MEEERILQNQAHCRPQGINRIRLNILTINQNLAAIKFIEAQEEVHNRRLTRPGCTYKGHRLAGFHLEANMLEDIPLTVIGETDIPELNAARPDFCDLTALGRFIVLLVNQGEDPIGRNHGSLQNGKVLGDFNQRVEELVGVLNEGIHKPRGHTSHLPGDPEIGQNNGIGQELEQGHGRPQE